MREYFVGIDNGGTTARAAIYTKEGKEIAVVGYPTTLLTPAPGHTERDMEEFWQVTARCVREAMEEAGIAPSQVACVACCGHGKGLYPVDQEGKPLEQSLGLFEHWNNQKERKYEKIDLKYKKM